MDKTATLKFISGEYAQGEYSPWTEYRELYAGRDGSGVYWFTKLSFSTAGLDIKKSKTLTITHTLTGTSNPYGTSAIITTAELSAQTLHGLTTVAKAEAVDGFVAYTHCDSHTSSVNVSAGEVITYTFDTEDLLPDTTYYVYIKRRLGLSNSADSSPSGWTEYYNPCHSDEYAAYSTLTLVYEPGGHVNIDDGTSFKKYAVYIDDGTSFKKYVPYIDNGSEWVPYSG